MSGIRRGGFETPNAAPLTCRNNDKIKFGMKTLTVTAARQKLGYWLKRAERGEEIGVVFGASVFALRKVPIQAADYMETEYGLTKEEADRAAERIRAETRADRAAGRSIDVTGKSLNEYLATGRAQKGHGTKAARRPG